MRPSTPLRASVLAAASCAATLVVGLGLAGCSASAPGASDSPEAEAGSKGYNEQGDARASAGLEDTDFGNLGWVYRPGGSVPETTRIELIDGAATDGMVSYELGDVVFADLTGDSRADAAAEIIRIDGNATETQWYLWLASDDGPVQSTLPVARMSPCGTVIHSVQESDGGIEIHESRRSVADQSVPCAEPGSDERTRTVGAIEARNSGEWWPVQVEPFPAFGGLCPATTHLESYPNDATLYPVPDRDAGAPLALTEPTEVFEIEAWPVYGEPFPGWVLAGVARGGSLACAWAERPE